jgi:hypothetical protein
MYVRRWYVTSSEFAVYQSERALTRIERSALGLADIRRASRFASAEAADNEAGDFLGRGGCEEEQAGGTSIVATNAAMLFSSLPH